jgi:hypothetical protein
MKVLSTVRLSDRNLATGRQTRRNQTSARKIPYSAYAAHSSPHNQTSERKKAARQPHTAFTVGCCLRRDSPSPGLTVETEAEPAEVLERGLFPKITASPGCHHSIFYSQLARYRTMHFAARDRN